MKYITIVFALVTSTVLQAGPTTKEFNSKQLNMHFQSEQEAKEWSLSDLPFDKWADAVSDSGWTEFYKSQSEDFYLAIYRSGQFLIFCINDRNRAYFGNTYSIEADNHDQSWAVPIVQPTVEWDIAYPNGKEEGQQIFATWKVQEEYKGDFTVKFSAHHSERKGKKEIKQTIKWD